MNTYNQIKVFSATKSRDRVSLGDRVTDYLQSHPELEVAEKVVTQSSDTEFHCMSITLFLRNRDEELLDMVR
jgi:hypothetical protein